MRHGRSTRPCIAWVSWSSISVPLGGSGGGRRAPRCRREFEVGQQPRALFNSRVVAGPEPASGIASIISAMSPATPVDSRHDIAAQ